MAFLDKLKRKTQEPEPHRATTPREECDTLLNEATKMALRLVEAHGHHFPFCLAVTATGERTNFAADDREVRDPDVLFETVRQSVLTAIRNRQLRAVALVKNVRYHHADESTPRDAVQITLDHLREDRGCTCYLPYRLIDGRVVPEELFATDPVEAFFTDRATFLAGSEGVEAR
jgi:hypothetical protein